MEKSLSTTQMMMNMTTRATRMPIMAGSTWGPTPPAMGGRIGEGEEGRNKRGGEEGRKKKGRMSAMGIRIGDEEEGRISKGMMD